MPPLTSLTIAETSEFVRTRQVSVTELIESHLDLIETTEPFLHSFLTVLDARALARARELDARSSRLVDHPALYGIPIAVKDIFDIRGTPTTMGCVLYANAPRTNDSRVVEKLEAAAAIVIGKLTMDEFAMGVTGVNPLAPPPRNPWRLDRIAGGSSSGCGSAVAASQCAAALGTDSSGSIRIPAALCGVTGLKPTIGSVTRHGVAPLSWSLDHVGAFGRTARDVSAVFDAIRGYDQTDPFSRIPPLHSRQTTIHGLRIGLALDGLFANAHNEIAAAVEQAAKVIESTLGGTVTHTTLAVDVPKGIIAAEAAAAHRTALESAPGLIGNRVREMLEAGLKRPAHEYVLAKRQQAFVRRVVERLFTSLDIVIAPTTPSVAPPSAGVDENALEQILTSYTGVMNQAGVPALSLPCGFSKDGLPIGMQLVASQWHGDLLLAVGAALQERTPFHSQRPPTADSGTR
jgi:aspartyl-tRNA(Asn)/glutamyl-tRNA(Gln) amidotransferase subunit A